MKLPNGIFEGLTTLNYCELHGWLFQDNAYIDVHGKVICEECGKKAIGITVTNVKYDEIFNKFYNK